MCSAGASASVSAITIVSVLCVVLPDVMLYDCDGLVVLFICVLPMWSVGNGTECIARTCVATHTMPVFQRTTCSDRSANVYLSGDIAF